MSIKKRTMDGMSAGNTIEILEDPAAALRELASGVGLVTPAPQQDDEADLITEALIESFPASDPPAWWAGRTAR